MSELFLSIVCIISFTSAAMALIVYNQTSTESSRSRRSKVNELAIVKLFVVAAYSFLLIELIYMIVMLALVA